MPVPQTLPEIKNAILRDTLDTLLEASTWVRVGRSAYLYINKATAATLAEIDEEDVPSEGDLPIPFASDNIHVHCGLDGGTQKYSLVVVDATQPVYDGDVPPDDRFDNNKEVTVDVAQYVAPVEVFPTYGKEAMKKVTVSLDNIPEIEANKAATINVSSYTEPVEVIPTVGKDGMAKATVTLSHVPSGNVPNFFSDTIPGFLLKDNPDSEATYPYYGVYADGTYVPSLAELANAQFFVPAYHGDNRDTAYRRGSTATIPHNEIFSYADDNDFTVTDGKITLKSYPGDSGTEYLIETATLYLNNCMASSGS